MNPNNRATTPVIAPAAAGKNRHLIAMTIIGALFFIFGFVTWLNGTLIPFLTPEGKLHYRLDKPKLREARRREGRYLLRTNLADETPDTLWLYYMQLVFVEEGQARTPTPKSPPRR